MHTSNLNTLMDLLIYFFKKKAENKVNRKFGKSSKSDYDVIISCCCQFQTSNFVPFYCLNLVEKVE